MSFLFMFHVHCLRIPAQLLSSQNGETEQFIATQTGPADHFWLLKMVPWTSFGCQIWQEGPIFGNQKWSGGPFLAAKIGPGTTFGQDQFLRDSSPCTIFIFLFYYFIYYTQAVRQHRSGKLCAMLFYNSNIPQTEQHDSERQMLFFFGNVTYLLDVTPSNPLPYPLSLHPFHAALFKFKDLVAKQHPTIGAARNADIGRPVQLCAFLHRERLYIFKFFITVAS